MGQKLWITVTGKGAVTQEILQKSKVLIQVAEVKVKGRSPFPGYVSVEVTKVR